MVLVRGATVHDVPWIMPELRVFAGFYSDTINLYPKDDLYARARLEEMIDKHLVLVAEDVEPMGFIAGLVTPHFFNPDLQVFAEVFWWVREAYRGSSAGLRLLRAVEAWSVGKVDLITMSLQAKTPVNPDCLLRRGYELMESSFVKVVPKVA